MKIIFTSIIFIYLIRVCKPEDDYEEVDGTDHSGADKDKPVYQFFDTIATPFKGIASELSKVQDEKFKDRVRVVPPEDNAVCKSLSSKKLEIKCFTSSGEEAPCNEHMKANYRATFDCNYKNDYTKIKEPDYTEITCKNGEWDKQLIDDFCYVAECERLFSERLDITCLTPNNETTSCDETMKTNFHATFDCLMPYKRIKEPEYTHITCRNREWDRPLVDDFCEVECGRPVHLHGKLGPSILKGEETIHGAYPWHAGIYFVEPKIEYKCGGTLISEKVVISAAHCFSTDNKIYRNVTLKDFSKIRVTFGKWYRNIDHPRDTTSAQIREVDYVHIPPSYRGWYSLYLGDIAFVVLKRRVTYTWAVIPICTDLEITSFNKDASGMEWGTIVGWGRTNEHDLSQKLMKTRMPFVSFEECQLNIEETLFTYVQPDKFCAGDKNSQTNVCSGDSGGGLIFYKETAPGSYSRAYLRGIVSLGPKVCQGETGFSVFTNLASYKDLVVKYIKL